MLLVITRLSAPFRQYVFPMARILLYKRENAPQLDCMRPITCTNTCKCWTLGRLPTNGSWPVRKRSNCYQTLVVCIQQITVWRKIIKNVAKWFMLVPWFRTNQAFTIHLRIHLSKRARDFWCVLLLAQICIFWCERSAVISCGDLRVRDSLQIFTLCVSKDSFPKNLSSFFHSFFRPSCHN